MEEEQQQQEQEQQAQQRQQHQTNALLQVQLLLGGHLLHQRRHAVLGQGDLQRREEEWAETNLGEGARLAQQNSGAW